MVTRKKEERNLTVYDVTGKEYHGRLNSFKIGESGTVCVEIKSKVAEIRWREVHPTTPQFVASQCVPKSYLQGHKHWLIEVDVVSDIYDAFDGSHSGLGTYYDEDGDNTEIPYFVFILTDKAGGTRTFTFHHATDSDPLLINVRREMRNYGASVWVYSFIASHCIET